MYRGLPFTLFVRFFDKNYVAIIPKSRIEDPFLIITSSFARFTCFSYCGCGFAHSTRFTSCSNPECMSEVIKLSTKVHGVENDGCRIDGC